MHVHVCKGCVHACAGCMHVSVHTRVPVLRVRVWCVHMCSCVYVCACMHAHVCVLNTTPAISQGASMNIYYLGFFSPSKKVISLLGY